MPTSQRGVIHLLLPLILLLGIIGGVFLVTNGNPLKLFSKAAPTLPSAPEASFELELEKSGESPFPDEATPTTIPIGSKFRVDIYARSDTEAANLFKASIHFTRDTDRISFIEPVEINKREGQSFVKNWVETVSGGTTFITMTGGVASPGIQTDAKSGALLMGSIVFEAKRLGKVKIELADDSAIYSNANNINILTAKKGTIEVEITDTQPSPTPTPVPHNVSCTAVLVEGGVQSKLDNGTIIYTVESDGKLKLTAQVTPANSRLEWKEASRSTNLPNPGSFSPSISGNVGIGTSVSYTAPINPSTDLQGVTIRADVPNPDITKNPLASCPSVTLAVKPAVQPTPTPSPAPSPVSGFGKSIKITSDNSYISTSIPGLITNMWGIGVWIKPDAKSLTGTNGYFILGKEFASGEISGFNLSVLNKKVMFTVAEKKADRSVANKTFTSKTELQVGKWYYISVSRVLGLTMYINGSEEAGGGVNAIQDNKDRKLIIGCAKPINFSCMNPFYGEIDEVRIDLNRGFPNPPTAPFTPTPDTQILYHLDGDAKDASSNHYDGQVTGTLQFVDSGAGACTSTLDKFQGINRCSGQFEQPKYEAFSFTCKSGYSSTVQVTGYPGCLYESDLQNQAKRICETPSPEHCSSLGGISPSPSPQKGSGDGNSDGKVDLADLSILLTDFNKSEGTRTGVDLNGDGAINTFDFSMMKDLLIQKGAIKE